VCERAAEVGAGIEMPRAAKKRRTAEEATDTARVLAACCASGAVFFTAAGASCLDLPAVPWTREYEKGLHARLLESRARGENLFNGGIAWRKMALAPSNVFVGFLMFRALC
jgi:hypothetical protein